MEPVEVLQAKLDELRSQAESTRREGNSYISTGHDIVERAGILDAEVEKFEAFLVQIEVDNAERAVRQASIGDSVPNTKA